MYIFYEEIAQKEFSIPLAEIRGRQLYFFSPAFQDFTVKREIFNAKCLLKLSNDMEWNIGSLNKLRLFF